MRSASRELLAPRADASGFFAEPHHLADWWPGIVGVEPDRRGFEPGARWKIRLQTHNVFTGRGERETMLLVQTVEPFERWSWHLLSARLDVELRLRALDAEPDARQLHGERPPAAAAAGAAAALRPRPDGSEPLMSS